MSKYINIIRIILIMLLISCLFKWEYGYYQLARFLAMVGFGLLSYINFETKKMWFLIWALSAILINPIFKIYLGRELWMIMDIIWIILLVFTSIAKQEKFK